MKISVIVPVYNVEKSIERCIRSILEQTFQDFEVVVVNDCTPDKSMDIVYQLAKDDFRFVFIEHERNKGLMWARYSGYQVAQGDYFVFCDSDDSMPKMALELFFHAIDNSEDDIVVGAYRKWVTSDSSYIVIPQLKYGNKSGAVLRSMLEREITFSLWGKIFRKSLFRSPEIPLLDNQTLGEDAILLSYLVHKSSSISVIPSVVYNYMYNSSSVTRNFYSDSQVMQLIRSSICLSNVVSCYPELKKVQNRSSIRGLLSLLFKHKCKYSVVKKNYDLFGRSYMFMFEYLFKYYPLLSFPIYMAMIVKRILERE